MNITTVGIDLAKNIFQLHGVNNVGETVLTKKLSRKKLPEFMAQLNPCLIGMESCGGSNYWGRRFRAMGHDVRLISPQFVKPYVKSNKNDAVDAEAICEAVARPNMRFVAIKTIEQQDIQSVHRIRARYVRGRTALANQIRGLLAEYGIVIPQGIRYIRTHLPTILEDAENELSLPGRKLFSDLYEQLLNADEKVAQYDFQIEQICQNNETCKRLRQLQGVGPLIATAIVASIGDAKIFKNGREMAAFIGLVPKQYSSGGKQKLLGISKRGDRYLRCLLIHGARAMLTKTKNLPKKQMQWFNSLIERRGRARATVALANKNTRIMWALMTKNENFDKTKI
jgi:transposase